MMTVQTKGKTLTIDEIRAWERRRIIRAGRYLQKKLRKPARQLDGAGLLNLKRETGQQAIRAALKSDLWLSGCVSALAVKLSFGKRRLCITEFEITGCRAEPLMERLRELMLVNSAENEELCLGACPDHYLLQSCGNSIQEVIEVTGGSPLPLRFFVTYDDESSLTGKREAEYPLQAAGAAKLANGMIIGGVRHQMKNTETGCKIKLVVEFPLLMPAYCIREHRMHLACEFYNWFSALNQIDRYETK